MIIDFRSLLKFHTLLLSLNLDNKFDILSCHSVIVMFDIADSIYNAIYFNMYCAKCIRIKIMLALFKMF